MEVKKSPKADLENKKGIFLQVGFIVVLAVLWLAFEWKTPIEAASSLGELSEEAVDQEIIPITRQDEVKPPPPPPPPPKVTEVLNIVDDDMEIEDVIFEDVEADEELEIDIVEFEEAEEEVEEAEIFFVVEEMPTFNGKGPEAFVMWVQRNMTYPLVAQENGIQGRVYVQFVVETNGAVTNVKVTRSVDPSLDKEAIRAVKNSPKWKPGKQRGRSVRVSYTIPVTFVLQ